MGTRIARPIPLDNDAVRKVHDQILRQLFKGKKPYETTSLGPSWPGYRDLARDKDAWDEPLRYLRGFGKGFEFVLPSKFITHNVKGQVVVVPVRVAWKRPKGHVPRFLTGGGVSTASGPGGHLKPVRLSIYLNPNHSLTSFVENLPRFSKELLSVLRHEVTHLRDLLPKGSGTAEGKEDASYYNKPVEVRAYMRQIIDEVLEEMEADAKASEGWIDTTSDSVERYLEKSPTWDEMHRFLNPSNRRTILKAVGQAVVREAPRLKEKYYVPWDDDFDDETSKLARRYVQELDQLRTRSPLRLEAPHREGPRP